MGALDCLNWQAFLMTYAQRPHPWSIQPQGSLQMSQTFYDSFNVIHLSKCWCGLYKEPLVSFMVEGMPLVKGLVHKPFL